MDDEAPLVRQAQADPQAFVVLYDRYINRIYAYIFRQTHHHDQTQDIVAAAFEKALRWLDWRRPLSRQIELQLADGSRLISELTTHDVLERISEPPSDILNLLSEGRQRLPY
jgi:hypothetical protein